MFQRTWPDPEWSDHFLKPEEPSEHRERTCLYEFGICLLKPRVDIPHLSKEFYNMLPADDFSTNRFSATGGNTKPLERPSLSRHADLCFSDGNLAVLAGSNYFLVHRGLLCRHSAPISHLIETLESQQTRSIEGRLILELSEPSNDVYYFLLALYDGMWVL